MWEWHKVVIIKIRKLTMSQNQVSIQIPAHQEYFPLVFAEHHHENMSVQAVSFVVFHVCFQLIFLLSVTNRNTQ